LRESSVAKGTIPYWRSWPSRAMVKLLTVMWSEGQKTFVDLIEDKPFKIVTVG